MSAVVEGSDLHVAAEARPDSEGYLASLEWRTWVRGHPFGAAAIAGLVATQMVTVVGYFLNTGRLAAANWPAVNGSLCCPGLTLYPVPRRRCVRPPRRRRGVRTAVRDPGVANGPVPEHVEPATSAKVSSTPIVLSLHQSWRSSCRTCTSKRSGSTRSASGMPFPLPQPNSAPPETFPAVHRHRMEVAVRGPRLAPRRTASSSVPSTTRQGGRGSTPEGGADGSAKGGRRGKRQRADERAR